MRKLRRHFFIPLGAAAALVAASWLSQKQYFTRVADLVSAPGIAHPLSLISTQRMVVAHLALILAVVAAAVYYCFDRSDLGVLYRGSVERFFNKFWPFGLILLAFLLYHPGLPLDPHHYHYFLGAVNDIYQGKGLLYETSHLYGLFDVYFLALLFKVIPFSYPMFAAVITAAYFLFFCGIFVFLRRWLNSYTLSTLGVSIIVPMLYFIRTSDTQSALFLPALSPLRWGLYLPVLFSVLAYARSGKRKFAHLAMVISAAAVFWNFDTGIFLSLATLATFMYQELNPGWNIREAGKILLHFFLYGLSLFALTSLINRGVYGSWPHWSLFLRESKDFVLGAAMHPLPPLGLYQIIFYTYLLSLAVIFYKLVGRKTVDLPLVFLSVYGVFSMVHYIGESTGQIFSAVTAPFVLIILYAVDNFWKENYQPAYERLVATGLACLVFMAAFLAIFKLPVEFSTRHYTQAGESLFNVRAEELDTYYDAKYLQAHYQQKRLPIISLNDTKLLTYSKKANYFDFYYIFTIYFRSQMQKYIDQARSEKPAMLIVGRNNYRNDQVEYFSAGVQDLYAVSESLKTVDVYTLR
ncbi:hypothetical protein HYZ80_03635 [Candidatus Parcubacteria bacterium]|nr:hypothetical protein [Candidatus Parcubacteria bacterium]